MELNRQAYELPEETTQEELLALIDRLNKDDHVNGILVQLPVPAHMDEEAVIQRNLSCKGCRWIPSAECRSSISIGQPGFVSCTPAGIVQLIESEARGVLLTEKTASVVGRSNIVGKPMAMLLMLKRKCHM